MGLESVELTEQGAINGSEGTTGEGELGSTVMGNEGVGVLEESDEDAKYKCQTSVWGR